MIGRSEAREYVAALTDDGLLAALGRHLSTRLRAAALAEADRRGIADLVDDPKVYGMCTACGSVEVALVEATGTRDLSGIGEHAEYPTGYGCEVCS